MPGPVILIFSPPVSQVRPAWRAYVLLLLLSSFSSSSSFNDRLEWSNEMISEPIPDRSSPNFQGWYLVDNLPSAIWYCFAIAQGTFSWQPILGAKSAKSAKRPSFLGLAFHMAGWQSGWTR